jgi:cyclophilin family peptidyl-prolyl cis-trans isomerase
LERRETQACVANREEMLKKGRTPPVEGDAPSILAALPRLMPIACLSAPALAGLALSACGTTAGGATSAALKAPHATTRSTRSPGHAGGAGAHACRPVDAPDARGQRRLSQPNLKLDPARRYVVTLATNCGSIEIQLDVASSPRTTASFTYLVQNGFYNQLTFHRVAKGFVIQGGDPEGDGSGGPGYTVVEPPPGNVRYTLGTVAMAKTETDPAGASGSQFFIVTAPDAGLPPQYALLGRVVEGLDTVRAISRLPTDPPQDGTPSTPVVIRSATLAVS